MGARILKIICNEGCTSISIESVNGLLGLTINENDNDFENDTVYLNREELQYLLDEINFVKNLIQ